MAANVDNLDPISGRAPLVLGQQSFHDLTEAVAAPLEKKSYKKWWLALLFSLSLLGVLGISVLWLFWEGTGVWGLNNPVGWGWAIVNFVWWVGIGHAGTLISAILFLFRQKWRTSINRSAEAMTLFAVMCAGLFPAIHVGRIWAIYWVFPIPNQMDAWPNFRSPLLWDVFAVSTYFTVSLLFWYVGLIPDLATMRDRAKTKIRKLAYGIFALGWRGSTRHWQHYEIAYLILAALATPLVLSVHTIVSFDFAVSQLPGWHTTIFPPYFVAGAIFSGFAMVLTLLIPARKIFDLEHIITTKHLENMAKIILLTGSLVGYAYAMEFFIAWYSGNEYEGFAFANRAFGDYAWAYWIMVSCNVISPQFFWIKKLRRNATFLFVISIFVNIGMWFERFVITVTSLHHDFLPSSWDYYSPTIWDIGTYVGSFGLFFTMFTLFCRFVPFVALAEVKTVLPQADPHYGDDDHGDDDHDKGDDDKGAEPPPKDAGDDAAGDDVAGDDDADEDEGKKSKRKKRGKRRTKKKRLEKEDEAVAVKVSEPEPEPAAKAAPEPEPDKPAEPEAKAEEPDDDDDDADDSASGDDEAKPSKRKRKRKRKTRSKKSESADADAGDDDGADDEAEEPAAEAQEPQAEAEEPQAEAEEPQAEEPDAEEPTAEAAETGAEEPTAEAEEPAADEAEAEGDDDDEKKTDDTETPGKGGSDA